MTPEEALEFLDRLLRDVPANREEHARIEEAVRIIGEDLVRDKEPDARRLEGLIE